MVVSGVGWGFVFLSLGDFEGGFAGEGGDDKV